MSAGSFAKHLSSDWPCVFSFRVEDVVDPAFENLGQAECQRQGWIEPSAFDGDDCLAGDTELIGEALL